MGSHRHRVRVLQCFAAGLLVVTSVVVGSSPASANTTRANTDSFSFSRTYAFPDMYVCVKYALTATITYNAVRYGPSASGYTDYRVTNVYVKDVRLTTTQVRYDPVYHSCTTTGVKWKRMEVSQGWAGYSCSFNPTISVSFPWSLSVSFWPGCSNRNQAFYRSTYDSANGLAGPSQTQAPAGSIHYGDKQVAFQASYLPAPTSGPCYGAHVSQHTYMNGIDRIVSHPAVAACLTPLW